MRCGVGGANDFADGVRLGVRIPLCVSRTSGCLSPSAGEPPRLPTIAGLAHPHSQRDQRDQKNVQSTARETET